MNLKLFQRYRYHSSVVLVEIILSLSEKPDSWGQFGIIETLGEEGQKNELGTDVPEQAAAAGESAGGPEYGEDGRAARPEWQGLLRVRLDRAQY